MLAQCCQLSPKPAIDGLVTLFRSSPWRNALSAASFSSSDCEPRTSIAPSIASVSISDSVLRSHQTTQAPCVELARSAQSRTLAVTDARRAVRRSLNVDASSANSWPGRGSPSVLIVCCSTLSHGNSYRVPSNPRSDGLRTTAAHELTHSQNAARAWPFKRQSCVLAASCTKNSASISGRLHTPKNSACVPSSVQSFGAGVAVAQILYGTSRITSVSWPNDLESWCLIMLDSSSTTPASSEQSNLCTRS